MKAFLPWRIQHVDLARGIPAAERDESRGPLFVVLWHGTQPLGTLALSPGEMPLSAAQLAQRAASAIATTVAHWTSDPGFEAPPPGPAGVGGPPSGPPSLGALLRLRRPLAALDADGRQLPRAEDRPRLSVIVCTRDRPDQLALCLRALGASTEPPDEIVVVDNAPTSDATRRVVEVHAGVIYESEPRPGLSRARNAGLRRARWEIVAFTDDDVVVHPAWTGRTRDALADARAAAMTGLVLPSELDTPAQVHFETVFGGFSQGFRRLLFERAFFERTRAWGAPVWRVGAGANMAFRAEVLRRLGGFDERLGAGAAGCSEDSEMWYRVLAAGHSCVYDPRAVVFHRHRGEVAALREQMRLYMRGHVAALLVQYERHRDLGNLRRIALQLAPYYGLRAARALFARGSGDIDTLGAEVRGAIAGVAYYLSHRTESGEEPRRGRDR